MFKANASGTKTNAALSQHRQMLRCSTALSTLMRAMPIALVAITLTGQANAQAVNWTGGNGNWTDPTKWSSGAVPNGVYADPNVATPTVIGTNAAGTVTINSTATARNVQVGNGSTLQVIGGGILNTTPAQNANGINTIGLASIGAGSGTMLVDGAGSRWNAGIAGVRVGNGAAGTLTVSNGGALNMLGGLLSVGLNAGGNGTLNINAGAAANAEALRLGYNGATGTVNITNGGTLQTSVTSVTQNNIGDASSGTAATGTVNISGANSSWTIGPNGELTVGNMTGGTGTIAISAGGKLTFQNTSNVHVGFLGARGTVTVTGANSLFESLGGVNIGSQTGSVGIATISNGGELKTGTGLGIGIDGATGTLTVDAGKVTALGGILIATGSTPGQSIGSNGKMLVSNGSTITTQGIFVGDAGAIGELAIAASQVTVTDNVTVANGAAAQGTLSLTAGSRLTAGVQIGGGYNGGTAVFNIDGANTVATAQSLSFGGGHKGTGTLNLSNGAAVTAQGLILAGDNGTDGPAVNANDNAKGTIAVTGGAALNGGRLLLGLNGGNGTLNVGTGGQVRLGDDLQIGWLGSTGTATVIGQGSKIDATGLIVIGHDPNFTGVASTGTLTVADGAIIKAHAINVGFGTGGAGTLNIGTGAVAGIIDPATTLIAMSGASSTINFNHNNTNYIFNTVIGDVAGAAPTAGSVSFLGTGTTSLTAVNTYTAATNVNAGHLDIAAGASIANSVLTTVASGAILSGAGAAGNVTVASGGTITPTGTNTLTVKNITFAAGSNYQVGLVGGLNGKIAADSATLQGGTVKVLAGTGNYAPNTEYTILSTTGGVTGTFNGTVNSDLTFLTANLTYTDPNAVKLQFSRNATSFASVASTPNQIGVANGLAGIGAGTLYNAIIQQNAGSARNAFDALSGEAHASAQTALITGALGIGDTINGRLSQPYDDAAASGSAATSFAAEDDDMAPLGYTKGEKKRPQDPKWPIANKAPVKMVPPVVYGTWAQGFGSWLNKSSDGNASALKSSSGGILAGIDATYMGGWRAGLAGGYSRTDATFDERASALDADNYHVAIYGGSRQGRFGIQTGLAYTWHEVSSKRSIAFFGFNETAQASYNASTAQAFGELNYRFQAGYTTLEPFAGLSYVRHHTDAFTETGSSAALTVSDNTQSTTFSTIGVRSSALLGQAYGSSFVGRGTVGWRHAYGDTDTTMLASFAGSTPFAVAGTPITTDALLAEAGLDVILRQNMTVGLAWSGQFGDGIDENSLKGQLSYRW